MAAPDILGIALARRACVTGDARRLRLEVGISLRELAAALGVDPASVSRWERGVARPGTANAGALGAIIDAWLEARGG